ncbi:MAG: hypothetical protein Kow0090_18550 [Myxococcota bacterium]
MTESGYTFIFTVVIVIGVIHLLYNFLAHTESAFWKTVDLAMIILGMMAFNYPEQFREFMETYLGITFK